MEIRIKTFNQLSLSELQLNRENDLSFIVDDIDDLVDDTQEGLDVS